MQEQLCHQILSVASKRSMKSHNGVYHRWDNNYHECANYKFLCDVVHQTHHVYCVPLLLHERVDLICKAEGRFFLMVCNTFACHNHHMICKLCTYTDAHMLSNALHLRCNTRSKLFLHNDVSNSWNAWIHYRGNQC